MTLVEIVGMVKDSLTAIAAVGAVVIGALGLQTWKRQLHGNANYDLARRFLRALYTLREAIRNVRNPFIFGSEVVTARKAAGIDEAPLSAPDDNRLTYQARWQKVIDARIEFDAELLEAEALWGPEMRTLALALFACLGELLASLEQWLARREEPLEAGEFKNIRRVIFESRDTSDEYSKRLNAAIQKIEVLVRRHLP